MKRLIFISIILLGASLAALAQMSVELSLPRNVVAGQNFTLTISVNNPEGHVSDVPAPELAGCELLYGPSTSTSQSLSIINGRRESSVVQSYTYTYAASQEGTVKVSPVTVKVGGKSLTTKGGQFSVLPPGQRQQQQQQQGGGSAAPARQQRAQSASSEFNVSPNDVFMRVELSQSSVYEQQAVECVVKLYTSEQQVSGLAASSLPTFDGCLIEDIAAPTSISWELEHYNGENYYTAVISRKLIYPQRAGDINISGGEFTATVYRRVMVQDFWMTRPEIQQKDITLKTRPATLHVRALPAAPAGFSGAVGQFRAEARLIGSQFKTNEASTLIYTITGTGNIKYLQAPQVDFPSEFEVYDPHVENTAHVSGRNMTGTYTAEYTFVPQSVGQFRIADGNFIYFDPARGEYVTDPIEGYTIDVVQGANVSSTGASYVGKKDIEAKNTDIHHIKPGADRPAEAPVYVARQAWFWAIFPLLIVLLAAVIFIYSRSAAARGDVAAQRLNKANKLARRRLGKAGKSLKQQRFDQFYAELLEAMQGYLGDKLSLPASQLSRDNVNATLRDRGASDELLDSLATILNECEMARYTPQSSPAQADEVYSRAVSVINQIENLKK